jgi:hypothetical protein
MKAIQRASFPSQKQFSISSIRGVLLVLGVAAILAGPAAFGDEIHDAAKAGDIAKVKALLKAKPSLVNNEMSHGWTPLHVAVLFDQSDVIEVLLANKADVNVKEGVDGQTPLHKAVDYGDKKRTIELLVNHGAEINAKDDNGKTPLDTALKRQRTLQNAPVPATAKSPEEMEKHQALKKQALIDLDEVIALLRAHEAKESRPTKN